MHILYKLQVKGVLFSMTKYCGKGGSTTQRATVISQVHLHTLLVYLCAQIQKAPW